MATALVADVRVNLMSFSVVKQKPRFAYLVKFFSVGRFEYETALVDEFEKKKYYRVSLLSQIWCWRTVSVACLTIDSNKIAESHDSVLL